MIRERMVEVLFEIFTRSSDKASKSNKYLPSFFQIKVKEIQQLCSS